MPARKSNIKIIIEANGKRFSINCRRNLFNKYRIKLGRSKSIKTGLLTITEITELTRKWLVKQENEMEKQILEVAKKAISDAIVTELTGYNKPLSTLTANVISDNSGQLYTLINDEFSTLLNSDDFKVSLKEALNKKLAQTLISRMGGELEKQVNGLKSNPATRAKITLAIDNIISGLD